jgi:cysteine desulfurase / selenocysteine lyase
LINKDLIKLEFPQLGGHQYFDTLTKGIRPIRSIKREFDYLRGEIGAGSKSVTRTSLDLSTKYEENIKEISKFFRIENKQVTLFNTEEEAIFNIVYSYLTTKSYDTIVCWLYDRNEVLANVMQIAKIVRKEIHFLKGRDSEEINAEINDFDLKNSLSIISSYSHILCTSLDLIGSKLINDTSEVILINSVSFNFASHELVNTVIIDTSKNFLGPNLIICGIDKNHKIQFPIIGSDQVKDLTEENFSVLENNMNYGIPKINLTEAMLGSISLLEEISLTKIVKHQQNTINLLVKGIENMSWINIINSPQINAVSFNIIGFEAHDLAIILSETNNIHLRSGQLCSTLASKELNLESIANVSTHIYNSIEDLNFLIEKINELF